MQLLPAALTGAAPQRRTHDTPRLPSCAARRIAAALLALALGASGCASVTGTMAAPQDEYLAYRRVRTTPDLEQRLAASWAYVERYPQGQWIGEVRPWFLRAELKYFEQRRETAAGLAAYLQALPQGPHASEARGALQVHRARARKDDREQLGLEALYTEERLAALAQEREHARDAVPTWLGRLLAIESWGERTSHLDQELLYEWRINPPAARCHDDRCVKPVSMAFSLPGGGQDASRVMVVDVVIVLENGGVAEARLQGPGLFSRMYEASTSRRVDTEAVSARVDAIAYAADVVRGAAESRLPSSRCAQDPVAPVVVSLVCDGWRVEARAAANPADDDEIVIRGAANR